MELEDIKYQLRQTKTFLKEKRTSNTKIYEEQSDHLMKDIK